MSGIEVILLIGFAGLIMALFAIKERRLADPSNSEMIHTYEMRTVAKIEAGTVYAELIRQSGNSYKILGQFQNSADAFSEIEASFRRAKIDSVAVLKNTTTEFRVVRLHHSHGGKSEGKKLGGALVCRV